MLYDFLRERQQPQPVEVSNKIGRLLFGTVTESSHIAVFLGEWSSIIQPEDDEEHENSHLAMILRVTDNRHDRDQSLFHADGNNQTTQ